MDRLCSTRALPYSLCPVVATIDNKSEFVCFRNTSQVTQVVNMYRNEQIIHIDTETLSISVKVAIKVENNLFLFKLSIKQLFYRCTTLSPFALSLSSMCFCTYFTK